MKCRNEGRISDRAVTPLCEEGKAELQRLWGWSPPIADITEVTGDRTWEEYLTRR